MRLREEYEVYLGRFVPDADILTDTEDEFSYITHGRDGSEIIVGFNRSTETFWRNMDEDEGF